MLNTMVSNIFPFEGDLAEKRPYKHRGKMSKHYNIDIPLDYNIFINSSYNR